MNNFKCHNRHIFLQKFLTLAYNGIGTEMKVEVRDLGRSIQLSFFIIMWYNFEKPLSNNYIYKYQNQG